LRAGDRFHVAGVTCELGGEVLPVVNLSLGGFYVATERAPIAGQVVATRLRLPGGVTVNAWGRVAWVNEADRRVQRALPPGCGIQATRVSFGDKLAIVSALRQFAPTPVAAG
jgi:hypothetical protein